MPKLYLIIVLLTGSVLAQSRFDVQSDTLRYRITTQQAKAFFDRERYALSDLDAPVDTLHTASCRPYSELEAGYYAHIFAQHNKVKQHVFYVGERDWFLAGQYGKPVLKLAQNPKKAVSLLKKGKRPMRYDSTLHGWRLPRKIKPKPYMLIHGQDSMWLNTSSWTKHISRYTHWDPLQGRSGSRYHKNELGYIITHQPMYRRGDTVKMKAFFKNNKGHPLNKSVTLCLQEGSYRRYGKKIIDIDIDPVSPGAFVYSLVLGDSLKLDKEYSLSVRHFRNVLATHFKLEDYVLEDAEYSFSVNSDSMVMGIPPVLILTAKAANGLPVMDGEAIITVEFDDANIDHIPNILSTFPDTLFVDTVSLDPSGKTYVHLPDSTLQYLGADYNVQVNFSDGSGDLVEEKKEISLLYPSPELHYQWRMGQLYIDSISYPPGCSLSDEQRVSATMYRGQGYASPEFHELPAVLPFDPSVNRIGVVYASKSVLIPVPLDGMSVNMEMQDGALYAFVENPLGLELNWEAWQKGKVVASGKLRENDTIRLNHKSTILTWSYFWKGAQQKGYTDYSQFNRALRLTVEQPAEALAGDTVDVVLRLSDQQGEAIVDADLTAWAYHRRFGTASLPRIHAGVSALEHKFKYADGRSYTLAGNANRFLDKGWAKNLGVHQSEGWNFLFPDSTTAVYDTMLGAHQGYATFAVFPYYKGELEPVRMIWINRKMVYSNMLDNPRYAITQWPGHYDIEVRTDDHTYFLENIILKKGHKLDLSFNAESWQKKPATLDMVDKISYREKEALNRHAISVRPIKSQDQNKTPYVSNGLVVWPLESRNDAHVIAPFLRYKEIDFGSKGEYRYRNDAEPGMLHSFDEYLLKIMPARHRWAWKNYYTSSAEMPGEVPLWYSDYLNEKPEYLTLEPVKLHGNGTKNGGNFHIKLAGKRADMLEQVWVVQDNRIWSLPQTALYLPTGTHRLYFRFENDSLGSFNHNFQHKTYWLNLDSLTLGPDTISAKILRGKLLPQEKWYWGNSTLVIHFPKAITSQSTLSLKSSTGACYRIKLYRKAVTQTLTHVPAG
ncbi:MAG: hypothetical protein AB8F95_06085, partial [Bacteroidia bacterium]